MAPTLEGDVLAVLAKTTLPMTGRQIASVSARGSSPAVSAALDRLVEQGLVHRQEAGSAYLHTLNRAHVAAPAVEILATLRSTLIERMRTEISAWTLPPLHASLFGSAARGDGHVDSDIDVLVIRAGSAQDEEPQWDDQLFTLGSQIEAWSGNSASVIEAYEEELAGWRRDPPSTVRAIREQGIHLAGVRFEKLLRG